MEIKEGMLFKSSDNVYIYSIEAIDKDESTICVDILNHERIFLANRCWNLYEVIKQIEAGTIIHYDDDLFEF